MFLLEADVERFGAGVSTEGGTIAGPALLRVCSAIARLARFKRTLHITGESGAGKERAARAFHALGPRAGGPFLAVSCAAIPEGLAERLLFGARAGASPGVSEEIEGYVQAAHGGVLFLDEVAELDLGVQAKLLRAFETQEVMPRGAARPVKVDFALVSATRKDLRAQVAAGTLREDLFFRIARPAVRVPPLRERPEEIPWLVDAAIQELEAAEARAPGAPLRIHASFVEACLLRAWPGNVRELHAEVQAAVQEARSAGSTWVQARHLAASAGQGFSPAGASGPEAAATLRSALPDDPLVEQALLREGGDVTRAARALGVQRAELRRWIARRQAAGSPEE